MWRARFAAYPGPRPQHFRNQPIPGKGARPGLGLCSRHLESSSPPGDKRHSATTHHQFKTNPSPKSNEQLTLTRRSLESRQKASPQLFRQHQQLAVVLFYLLLFLLVPPPFIPSSPSTSTTITRPRRTAMKFAAGVAVSKTPTAARVFLCLSPSPTPPLAGSALCPAPALISSLWTRGLGRFSRVAESSWPCDSFRFCRWCHCCCRRCVASEATVLRRRLRGGPKAPSTPGVLLCESGAAEARQRGTEM